MREWGWVAFHKFWTSDQIYRMEIYRPPAAALLIFLVG